MKTIKIETAFKNWKNDQVNMSVEKELRDNPRYNGYNKTDPLVKKLKENIEMYNNGCYSTNSINSFMNYLITNGYSLLKI